MFYFVHVDVTRARGRQTWKVEAESEQQARDLYDQGEGDLVFEELEADDSEVVSVELPKVQP